MDNKKYELLGTKVIGGMGEVCKVRHRNLDVVRALKKIRYLGDSDLRLRERFQHEAKIAAKLQHQNLAQVYDFEILDDGTAYMVLEWIDGLTLWQILGKPGRPTLEFVLQIAQQALSALGYLHQQEIVHRDVSPDNFMVIDAEGDCPIVKLIDLGIAKEVDGGAGLTNPGGFVGKLPYAAPETLGSMGKPDPRSDLYSFGVVLYELLTGERPVVGESTTELVDGHLYRPPRPFDETDPSGRVPMELRAIVLEALKKDPGKRFQSAADFARALSSLRPSPAGQEQPDRDPQQVWFSSLRKLLLLRPGNDSKRPTSSPFDVVRTLPKPFAVVTSAVLLVGLVSGLVILSGSVETPVEPVEPKAGIEAGSAETVKVGQETKPPEGDAPAPAQTKTAPAPAAVPPAGPAPLRVVIIADDDQLAATIQNHLDPRVEVEIRPGLWAVSAQDSAPRLAIKASAGLRQFSVEAYDTLVPACEAAVTGRLVEIPRGRTFFARTITRTAPRCGEALEEAAGLLSDVLAPRTLELLLPG